MNDSERTIILVTGATGTMGSEVVKQLCIILLFFPLLFIFRSKCCYQRQLFILKIKLISLGNMVVVKQQLKLLIWIIINRKLLLPALNKVGKLFLLTLPSLNMADISSEIVREAKKNGVQHIVKLSVFGADAEPGIIIGRLHRQEEKIIEESGITYTFLRSSAFMQNFVNYYNYTIKTQNAIYLPAGEGKVSFVDARDVAAVVQSY